MQIKKERILALLIILSCVFFVIYSILGYITPHQYNSPDEQGNYFFIQHLLEHGTLTYNEPLNAISHKIVRPRSTGVIGTNIVPGSFLGLIIFISFFAKLFGSVTIPFIIPLLSACTPIFFYFALKRFFSKDIAAISAVLLYIHPAFWYYSTRSLFPNILLIDLLIVGITVLLYTPRKSYARFLLPLISGAIIGFALGVRINEFLWVSILLILLYIYNRRSFNFAQIIIFGLGGVIGIMPSIYQNLIVYGHPLFTGYFEVNTLIQSSEGTQSTVFSLFKVAVLPFGFKLKNIIKNALNYHLYVFYVLVPFLVAGCILFIKDWKLKSRSQRYYVFVSIIIALVLIIYYGSWKFNDHPDPRAISIGTSYIRYWLPIYIMSLPAIALSFEFLASKISVYFKLQHKIKYLIICICILLTGLYSSGLVLNKTDESILNVVKNIHKGEADAQLVINSTEESAVIIVDYDDKFLFPHRRVMIPFRNDYVLNTISDILKHENVYYFGLELPAKDINYLNDRKLKERNLYITEFKKINNKMLYKIHKVENI